MQRDPEGTSIFVDVQASGIKTGEGPIYKSGAKAVAERNTGPWGDLPSAIRKICLGLLTKKSIGGRNGRRLRRSWRLRA